MTPFKPYLIFAVMLILLPGGDGLSQTIPDSLFRKLTSAKNDSAKGIILLEIGESIEVVAPKKSMAYYRQALSLGIRIKNNRVILSSYHDIGICYINLNEMDSAIMTFEEAVPLARLLSDTLREARLLANIGNAYLHKKDRATAIEYYLQSSRIWEACTDQNYLPALYSNINSLLDEQKEHDRALEYGNKSLTLAQKIGDKYSMVNAMVNLSTTYSHLGQHEKEYKLLEQALPLAKENEDLDQISTVYHNIGDYYFNAKNFTSALGRYLESYNYVKQMGNPYHLCEICTVLALVYHKLNQDSKALHYILQAEKLAAEIGVRTKLKEIYLTRAEIEQKAGNYRLSNEYYSKTLTVSDSLFKTETSEKVAEAEARYQNEMKQKEIVQLGKDKQIQSLSLKQKSTLNYILFGSLAVLILLGSLLYRNYRQKQQLQQQRISELEKDRQLVAVDSMLKGQEEERSRLAKDLHDGLGGLLSGVKFSLSNMKDNLIITPDNMTVFERSLDMIDTSIKELRRVAHNMMPEMLIKFGLDEALKEYCNTVNATKLIAVKYQSFGMETRIDSSKEIIIYRVVQELLNNTLKHAEAKEVLVQLVKEGERLSLLVEDNGHGFDTAILEKNSGAGWTSIRSRVDYLQGRLDIHAEANKGTSITIDINV
jgi:two-component system NarL family sensor kinase